MNPLTLMSTRLSLRARLMLWYSLVFAASLFSIGLASLWMVNHAIDELEQNELRQRVRSVSRFLESRPEHETLDQTREAMSSAYNFSHGNKWVQVIDEHGNWLYRSSHVVKQYPELLLPQQVAPNGTFFQSTIESIPVSALIAPIKVNGVSYTVQTGLTLTKALATLSNVRIQLSILTVLGFLISSLAGYFMSRKALTPIAAIASEAQRINSMNLNSRMPELQTRDELASLTDTLNRMLGRIESGFQSVRSFTANAAHELRSPVALLRAEAEVTLAFPRDGDYYRNTCAHVLQNSMQMSRMIDQLLALARADAGVDTLKFEAINLPDLVQEISSEWAEQFKTASIQFTCDISAAELFPQQYIDADYLSLKRLLNILLENAWRYTPTNGSVTLALVQHSAAAVLSIKDTGIGIAPDDQQRIFDRFARAANPLHGEYSGSGLGLALGQWIASRHNTTIQLLSSPGEGSCFSLEFPWSRQSQMSVDSSSHGHLSADRI